MIVSYETLIKAGRRAHAKIKLQIYQGLHVLLDVPEN